MSRNNNITKQFLAKQLWRYRAAKPKEIVTRLLEFECIRRNYTKSTLFAMAAAIRAYDKNPETKSACKWINGIYKETIEKLKRNDSNLDEVLSVAAAEGLCEPEEVMERQISVESEDAPQEIVRDFDKEIEELEEKKKNIDELGKQIVSEFENKISELEKQKQIILNEQSCTAHILATMHTEIIFEIQKIRKEKIEKEIQNRMNK